MVTVIMFSLENKLETENLKHCRTCKVFFSESNKCLSVQDVMFLLQRIKSKALFLLSEDQNLRYTNMATNNQ